MNRKEVHIQSLFHLVVLLSIGVYTYYVKLGDYPLQPWDEGWYALQGQSIANGGAWLATATFNQASVSIEPQMLMPPFFAWMQAISFTFFGFTEFAARFPSATATILTAVFIYWIGAQEFDRRVGWIAGCCWLILPALFAVTGGRQATEDVLFTLVGTLYVYAAYRVVKDEDPQWLVPTGLFAGLALLTKGFNAGIFVIILLPLVAWQWKLFLDSRYTPICVGLTVAIGGLWPSYMWWRYGDVFVDRFVVSQVIDRAVSTTRGDPVFAFMNFPYLRRIPTYLDPVLWFLIPGLLFVAIRWWPINDRWRIAFFGWWGGSVLGFFMITGTHPAYIFPALVPAVILVGVTVAAATRGDHHGRIALIAGSVLVILISPRFGLTPIKLPVQGIWGRDPTRFFLRRVGLGIAVSGVLMWPWITSRLETVELSDLARTGVPVVLALLCLFSMVAPASYPAPGGQKEAGHWVNEHTESDTPLQIIKADDTAVHSLVFYANRGVERTTVRELNQDGQMTHALVPADQISSVERSPEINITVGTRSTDFYLLGFNASNR